MKETVTKRLTWSALTLIAFAGFGSGCAKDPGIEKPSLRRVITHIVELPSATQVRRFSGELTAAEGTGIAFEVGGRVIRVRAKAGERIPAGELLAELDPTDYLTQLRDAEAQFTNAEQERRRIASLLASGNASQSQFEGSLAQEKRAGATLDRAKKAVKDCQLSMPYTGVIGRVEVEPEDIVSAGQSVMTVQGENGLEFEIGVPATDVASLKVGMEATLSVSALLDRTFRATISEISPEVANNTTYPVTLSLAKGAEGVADLRPGLDGEAALVLPNPLGAKMRVPAVSVFGAPGPPEESDTKALTYVWVVQATTEGKGQLEKRQVRTAMLADRAMLEIESGLSAGEKVVIRGVHRLEEGMTVLLED